MKWWFFLLAAGPALFGQTVDVTVLNADGSGALAGVQVELEQNGYAMRQAFTDNQGSVHFETVATGSYSLHCIKPGYRQTGRTVTVTVAAGGTPIRLETRLLRLGHIVGRVTGDGKPVARAQVQLFLSGEFIGQIVITDAKGDYEFRDVDPGTYVVSARATKSSPAAPDEDGRKRAWVRTWYPSASDATAAARVVIVAGTDLYGEDIEMRAVPVHRVSGRVLSTKNELLQGTAVKAAPPEEFAVAEFELSTQTDADGVFVFEGLADGRWRLTAETKTGNQGLYAALVETVDGHDLERLELHFMEPLALQGRVVRTATGTPAEKKKIGVMLAPLEGGYRSPFGPVAEDGSFQLLDVAQGVYRFQPTSPGAPYYLASVEMNGRDVVGQWVEIASGTLPVTITYRSDGGTVRGTVEDCAGGTVVLAPQEAALQYSEFVRQEKCGQGGRFEIANVRPGEYYAFAFNKPIGMQELGGFAARWLNEALRITVRSGEATDASLKVTQRGAY